MRDHGGLLYTLLSSSAFQAFQPVSLPQVHTSESAQARSPTPQAIEARFYLSIQDSSHTLLSQLIFSDGATQYFCWMQLECTTIGAYASKEVYRVEHKNRLQHPDAALGRRAHCSRSQLFLSMRFGGSPAQTERIRWMPLDCGMDSGSLHAVIEGIITVLLR